MDKVNSKILTVSFAVSAFLLAFTVHLLIRTLAGAFGWFARFSDTDLIRHGLPVALGFAVFAVLQFHPKVSAWGEDVVQELRKVVWPSRKDTTAMTIVVIIMVIISSLVVTSFDFLSGYVLKMVMN